MLLRPYLKPLIPVLILSLILLILQFFTLELRFLRPAISDTQWWRLWSGNLVHFNMNHLLLNFSGLWLLVLVFPQRFGHYILYRDVFWLCTGVGLGLFFFSPQVIWYVGLSGALYGLFVVGGFDLINRRDYITGGLALMIVSGKIIWEQIYGGSEFSAQLIESNVIIDAHLYGTLSGYALGSWLSINAYRKQTAASTKH